MTANHAARDTPLGRAIRRGDWELVSLSLLLGYALAIRSLPPEAIDSLLSLLAGDDDDDCERSGGRAR